MYIGAMIEAAPIPSPPINLQMTNWLRLAANHMPSDDKAKQAAQIARPFFRPMRSTTAPAPAAPTVHPISAHPAAQPDAGGVELETQTPDSEWRR